MLWTLLAGLGNLASLDRTECLLRRLFEDCVGRDGGLLLRTASLPHFDNENCV